MAEIRCADVPVIAAARDYVQQGIAPGGTHANLRFLADWVGYAESVTKEERLLLCDAQTSGGLLAAVPAGRADVAVAALRSRGVSEAAVIGRLEAGPARIRVG
jgi:selenide,water dikinase